MRTTLTNRLALVAGGTAAASLLLAFGAGLQPLAAADRPALALIAVTLSLPLGAFVSGRANSLRDAGERAGASMLAGVLLAACFTLFEPALFLRTAIWCGAGALLGGSLGALHLAAGITAVIGWLLLCGLPFFVEKLPGHLWRDYALHGCPWLGFSQDAFGGDPLRRSVLYLGHWSELRDEPAFNLLRAHTLWLTGTLTLAAALLHAATTPRKQAA